MTTRSLTSFCLAMCVLRTESLQVTKEMALWPFGGGGSESQPVNPVQQFADQLEEQNLKLLKSIFEGSGAQGDVTNFNGAIKAFQKEYLSYHMAGGKIYETFAGAMEDELLKAWRFTETMKQDFTVQGPEGIFLIHEGVELTPPANALPIHVAEWYLAKVASLDAFARNALETGDPTRKDEAYHTSLRMSKSIEYSVTRDSMGRDDLVSKYAAKVLRILQDNVKSVQEQLLAQGAQAPLVSEDSSPMSQRVTTLEESTVTAIGSILAGNMACSDSLQVIAQLKAAVMDEPGSAIGGTTSLQSRVLAVQGEMSTLCKHIEVLSEGENIKALNVFDSTYIIDDTVDLAPPATMSATELVEWYLPKIASLSSLATNVKANTVGIQAAYIISLRLLMGLESVLDRPMVQKNIHAANVLTTLRDRVAEIQGRFLTQGAHKYGLEGSQGGYGYFGILQLSDSHFKEYAERKTMDLEDSGVVLLEGIFDFSVQQANLDEFVANISKFKLMMPKLGALEGQEILLQRAESLQSELLKVWHQRMLLAGAPVGTVRGPNGLYSLNSSMGLVTALGAAPETVLEWYLAKTMSFNFIVQNVLSTHSGYDAACVVGSNLQTALSIVGKRPFLQGHHAKMVMEMLGSATGAMRARLGTSCDSSHPGAVSMLATMEQLQRLS